METRTFGVGEVVFAAGDASHEAYRIISGKVEISIGGTQGPRSVAQLSDGEIFGEMGLVGDKPRSATATALERTTVRVITAENFTESVLDDAEELQRYLATLIGRLRTTDALLEIALRQVHEADDAEAADEESSVEYALATRQSPVGGPPPGDYRLLLTSAYEPGRWRGDTIAVEIASFPFRIGCQFVGPEPPFIRNDLLVRDTMPMYISRDHCAVEKNADGFYIRDRGSLGGTNVNGKPIGIKAGVITAPLVIGENVLILGNNESPHRFFLHVMPVEGAPSFPEH